MSGFHVDPGFAGHLIYAVYNAGPSSVHLERGEELFLIWFTDLDKADPVFTRHEPPINNISPRMITDVSGEILTLQSLSKKIEELDRAWYRIKVIGAAAFIVIALLGAGVGIARSWSEIKNMAIGPAQVAPPSPKSP